MGGVFPAFVANTAGKLGHVGDYKRANPCLEDRSWLDQLSDLAAVQQPEDELFKEDVKDA